MKRVLSLTEDGIMSFCTATPENRGKGRCNHVAHQRENESREEFITRVEDKIHEDGDESVSDALFGNSKENSKGNNLADLISVNIGEEV